MLTALDWPFVWALFSHLEQKLLVPGSHLGLGESIQHEAWKNLRQKVSKTSINGNRSEFAKKLEMCTV